MLLLLILFPNQLRINCVALSHLPLLPLGSYIECVEDPNQQLNQRCGCLCCTGSSVHSMVKLLLIIISDTFHWSHQHRRLGINHKTILVIILLNYRGS